MPGGIRGSPRPMDLLTGKFSFPLPLKIKHTEVGKMVGRIRSFWYLKNIEIRRSSRSDKVLASFGAVDWEAEVFVNGQMPVVTI